MDELYSVLRSYVNGTNFDYHRFELDFEYLNNTIYEISIFIWSIRGENDFLHFSAGFAIYCLNVMRMVQENMLSAEAKDEPYYRLFYEVSELRVLILDKFNLNGVLDFQAPYFEDYVTWFKNRLLALKVRYINLEFIPLQTRTMLWNHLVHSETMLQVFESYLSPQEEPYIN